MIPKKIKIADTSIDPLKEKMGRSIAPLNGRLVAKQQDNPISVTYEGSEYRNTPDGFYELKQTIIIPESEGTGIMAGEFTDHLSEIVAPVFLNEIAGAGSRNACSGFVKTNYNFYSKQYENFAAGKDEKDLPCIYLENSPQQARSAINEKVFGPRMRPKSGDFVDFDYRLKPLYKGANIEKTRNLVFNQGFNFNIANAEKTQYPFYNHIKFNYNTTNDFKNVLKQFNFFEHFIDDYFNALKNKQRFNIQVNERTGGGGEGGYAATLSRVTSDRYEIFDALGWVQSSDFSFNDTNKLVLGALEQKYKNSYQYLMDKLTFVGKMRKFCRNKMRNIEEIHTNQLCKTETLFYRINKYIENRNSPVQSFWIPGNKNYIDYIDTQIKYGVKYTYRVSAFVLVFGSKYSYENIQTRQGKMYIDAIVKPSFKVVAFNNIFSNFARSSQPPQPVPDVFFANESNKGNYIKIYMNLSKHSDNSELITINENEKAQDQLKIEYDRLEERPRFVYTSESALFEIYRTETIPERYEDLRGNKLAEIRNSSPSTGAMYKDHIKFDKKYYYVIRSINAHGFVSNPTPIYEIEMTKDADESFLNVRSVPLHKDDFGQPTRTFMKLMQAIPATQHTFYNENKLADTLGGTVRSLRGLALKNMTLGEATHPIWGKKFKFRVTSKETGRKIDFNIKVNLIKKKTKENSR